MVSIRRALWKEFSWTKPRSGLWRLNPASGVRALQQQGARSPNPSFGTVRSEVRILSPRPELLRKFNTGTTRPDGPKCFARELCQRVFERLRVNNGEPNSREIDFLVKKRQAPGNPSRQFSKRIYQSSLSDIPNNTSIPTPLNQEYSRISNSSDLSAISTN